MILTRYYLLFARLQENLKMSKWNPSLIYKARHEIHLSPIACRAVNDVHVDVSRRLAFHC